MLYDGYAATNNCVGDWAAGLDDIVVGAAVVITDGTGTTIATTQLTDPEPDPSAATCTFQFRTRVTTRSVLYGVAVSHRGILRYTESSLESGITQDLKIN